MWSSKKYIPKASEVAGTQHENEEEWLYVIAEAGINYYLY